MSRCFLLLAVSSSLFAAMAPPVRAETLAEVVDAALHTHPAIGVAQARREGAVQSENEALSKYFPQLETNFSGGRIYGDNSTTRGLVVERGAAYSWLWEGSATLTQPMFTGFETTNRYEAASARKKAADFTLADVRQAVGLRAVQSYLNVCRSQEALEKIQNYQSKISDYLARIDTMVESGAADASEAQQARNIQSMLENTKTDMEGQFKTALADYIEIVGGEPAGDLSKTPVNRARLFSSQAEAISYAFEKHPMILSALQDMAAEDEDVSAEKGVFSPDVNGEVSYLKRDQKDAIGGEALDARALMRLSWSFETGGGQIARLRKARAEKQEAVARYEQAKRDIERDIRRSYAESETASHHLALVSKRVDVTRNLLGTYQNQFDAARVRLLQVMQADNQLFTTEMEEVDAVYRQLIADYTILAATGNLLEHLLGELSGDSVAEKTAETLTGTTDIMAPRSETVPPMEPSSEEERALDPVYPSQGSNSPEKDVSSVSLPSETHSAPDQDAAPVTEVPGSDPLEAPLSSVYPQEDFLKGNPVYPHEDYPAAEQEAVQ